MPGIPKKLAIIFVRNPINLNPLKLRLIPAKIDVNCSNIAILLIFSTLFNPEEINEKDLELAYGSKIKSAQNLLDLDDFKSQKLLEKNIWSHHRSPRKFDQL